MNPLYIPLLRAKKGEFDALSYLSENTKSLAIPLMDIPLPKKDKSVMDYLDDVTSDLGKAWGKHEIFFDMPDWLDNAQTDEGEHTLLAVWRKLEENNIVAHPVIGFDKWGSPEYVQAIKNILDMSDLKMCLRLDVDAIQDISLMEEVVDSINYQLNLQSESNYALLDLEDMTSIVIDDITPKIGYAINFLKSRGFSNIILAGSSMPNSITFIPQENSSKLVTRKELILWKILFPEINGVKLCFGDYGIRNPRSSDDIINPHRNGKIRYTIPNQYFVVRGHSMKKFPKGEQYYKLAKMVITSPHYMGVDFSWGDKRIFECMNEVFKGSSTNWVSIDTNHHIEHVLVELSEFVRTSTKAKTAKV